MAVNTHKYKNNGFFGIGIMNNVNGLNIGTLWRSAYIMGASYIFTIDKKYKKQMSDVTHTWKKIPLYHYKNFDDFYDNQPAATRIIAVELDDEAVMLDQFEHPAQACYLLGNEQAGLAQKFCVVAMVSSNYPVTSAKRSSGWLHSNVRSSCTFR